MANQLSEKPPEAAPAKTYTEADLRAAQAEAANKALVDSNRMLQEAALTRNIAPPPQPPRGPDPFERYGKEGLTLPPEEQARLLRQGAQSIARGEGFALASQLRGELQAAKDEMALRMVLSGNPDITEEEFAAAFAKAGLRAQRSGQNVDGPTLAQMAVSIHREENKPPAQAEVPFVEGAGRPAGSPGSPAQTPAKRTDAEVFLEEAYGIGTKWGDEFHDGKRNPSSPEAIDEYLDQRHSPITDGGITEWGPSRAAENSRIGDVLGPALQRATRRAAVGGK